MKVKYLIPSFIGLFAILSMFSCKESAIDPETNAPQQLTNIQFTPNNGGGFFTYTIPEDEDFLYAMAEYKIDNGQTIRKSASTYSDTLFIEGLGSVKEYDINLYSIDRLGNKSNPVLQKVTPLEANVNAVINTVTVNGGFSSIIVGWENPLRQKIDVCVELETEGKKATRIQSSTVEKDNFTITNLTNKPHKVSVYIRDNYENKTEAKAFGEVTPKLDGKLHKKTWTFLYDHLLYGDKWDKESDPNPLNQKPKEEYMKLYRSDSMKNAREINFEGSVWKMWDNEYDDESILNLNYCHTGGQTYPFSYFIDMGRTVQASRISIWMRDAWGQLWGGENVEVFEIWINDDNDPSDGILDNWEYVGRYKMVKPSDPVEAKNLARAGVNFILYPDNPRFTKPFRYLRYKAILPFNKTNQSGCTSEITLFGVEEDGTIGDQEGIL